MPGASDFIAVPSGTVQFAGNQVEGANLGYEGGAVTFDLSGGGLTISPVSAYANVVALMLGGAGSPLTVEGANTLTTAGIEGNGSSLTVMDGATVMDQMLPGNPGIPYLYLTLGALSLQGNSSFDAPGQVATTAVTLAGSNLTVGDIADFGPLMVTGGSISLTGVAGSPAPGGVSGNFGNAAIAGGTIKSAGNLDFGNPSSVSGGASISAADTLYFNGAISGHSTLSAAKFSGSGTIDASTVTATTVSYGGTLSGGAHISSTVANSGNVTLTGGDTRWINKGPLTIRAAVKVEKGAHFDIENGNQTALVTESSGSLTVADAHSTFSDAGDMIVATTGTAAVTVTVKSGAILNVDGNLDIAQSAGSTGTVAITGDQSMATVGGTLTIGDGGVGQLTVGTGAMLDRPDIATGARAAQAGAADIVLGAQAAPAGGVVDPVTGLHVTYLNSLTVAGDTVAAGSATVGDAGYGGILLTGAASTLNVADELTLADQAGSEGQVIVDGTNAAVTTGDLTVGSSGKALLTIGSGNSVTTNGDAKLAENSGSEGTAILGEDSLGGKGGGHATWSIAGDLTVGDGGMATLESNVSTLQVGGGSLSIGGQAGSNGLLTMDGGQLSFGGTLTVGDQGTGELLFQLGATSAPNAAVTTPMIMLGAQQGAKGTLVVTGQGTELQATGLTVGAFGQGSAQILSGAKLVVNGPVDVADGAEGLVDSITASGGSDTSINGDLSIGTSGVATLQVQSEAQLAAAGTLTIGDHPGGSAVATISGSTTNTTTGKVTQSYLGYGLGLVVGADGVGTLLIQNGALGAAQPGGTGLIEVGAKSDGSGTVTVQGVGSTLKGSTLAVGGSKVASGGSGTLTIMKSAAVDVSAATIWSGGQVDLSGGTLQAKQTTLDGGKLVGEGSVTGAITDDGSLMAKGGTLQLAGKVSGTGTLAAASGAVLALTAGGALTEASSGSGMLKLDGTSTYTLTGTKAFNIARLAVDTGTTLSAAGTLASAISNGGDINISGMLSLSHDVTGTGTLAIGATGNLSLLAGSGAGQMVDFLAGTGVLSLMTPSAFLGSIAGFTGSDSIDLLNSQETGFAYANGILTVTNGTTTEAALRFSGSYSQSDFAVASDHHGGTVITFT